MNGYYDYGYCSHLCGTLTLDYGNGSNSVMSFSVFNSNISYSFGAQTTSYNDRSTAAQVRCVRDE